MRWATRWTNGLANDQPSDMRWREWSFRLDWWLALILGVSIVLRLILAQHGGQMFYPDESRYNNSGEALDAFHHNDPEKAMGLLFSHGDHLGFRVIMLAAAVCQTRWDLDGSTIAFLGSGLFSVICILLTYLIVRRLGGDREEARWTALFMAVANSLFYWSRHILPYDMALCFALGGLFVGVHPNSSWCHSVTAGCLGFLAFVTYNGYWTMVGVVLGIHVMLGWPSIRQLIQRSALGAIALALPMIGLLWWAEARGFPLIDSYFAFSESIRQGDFSDGHRMIIEYLWYSEHGLLVVWILSAGYFIAAWATGREGAKSSRARIGLFGALALAVTLIWFSNVQHKFVVYGRLVRQIVPFLSLLSGWAAARFCERFPKWGWRRLALALALVAFGAFNFRIPLSQSWDFEKRAIKYRDDYRQRSGASEADRIPIGRFRLVMQEVIWPIPKQFDLPPHKVLMKGSHVLQFEPLLYEGYNRKQRAAIRATDISDKLILLDR